MLRSGLPWFLAGLGLVALAATLAAAPRYVLLGGGSAPPIGSFLDNGSLGTSLAAKMLAEQGFPVGLGLTPPPGWRGPVVYLAAGPLNCSRRAAVEAASVIREAMRQVGRAGVVVAGPPGGCVNALLEALGAPPLAAVSRSTGVYVAVPVEKGAPVLALYAPYRVAAAPGWRIAAYAVNAEGDRVPGLLVYDAGGLRVVYIPSPLALSNLVLRAEEEAGLDPRGQLAALVRYAAGAGAGEPVAVVQPPLLLPHPRQAGAPLQPGALLLSVLDYYRRFENQLYRHAVHNPFLVAAATVVAAALVYLASVARGGRSVNVVEKPLSRMVGAGGAPGAWEALAAAVAALRAAGLEPESLLRDEELARRLSERSGVRPGRLRVLLAMATGRRRLLPLIERLRGPKRGEAEALAEAAAGLLEERRGRERRGRG